MCCASWLCFIKWQPCAESVLPSDHRPSYLRQHSLRRMREYLDCLDTWDQSCIKDSANPTVHSCWAGGISCLLSEPGYKVQVRMESVLVSCLFSYCGTASQRKTQNALCIFCNSLIHAFVYFLECTSEGTPTQTLLGWTQMAAQLTCQVFWNKPKSCLGQTNNKSVNTPWICNRSFFFSSGRRVRDPRSSLFGAGRPQESPGRHAALPEVCCRENTLSGRPWFCFLLSGNDDASLFEKRSNNQMIY